jgi:formylglycine-generating enzyme required for sulfatase activity
MKWSDLEPARPAARPRPDQVEDRILDYFSRRLGGEFILITRDTRLSELRLDGPASDAFLAFLRDQFGFEAGAADAQVFLDRAGSIGRVAEQVVSSAEAPPPTVAAAPQRPAETRRAAPPEAETRPAPARAEPRPAPPSRPPEEIRILEVTERAARKPEPPSVHERDDPDEPERKPSRSEKSRVVVDSVAGTQMRGEVPTEAEWIAGPLYEAGGKTREGVVQFLRRTDGMRCILIPADEVALGDDTAEKEQRPARKVKLAKFLIDAEPVCCGAFARFLNAVGSIAESVLTDWIGPGGGGSGFPLSRTWGARWTAEPGTDLEPMTMVTWFGANAYSLWANRWDWRYYRGDGTTPEPLHARRVEALPPSEFQLCSSLPSEAQWEYAARGAAFHRFPWGDEPANSDCVGLFRGRDGRSAARGAVPPLVNLRLGVSPFGVHHMAGSLRQWCRDWYSSEFYSTAAAKKDNPVHREGTGLKSERAGAGAGDGYDTVFTCSHRRGRAPPSRSRTLGFRCIGAADEV